MSAHPPTHSPTHPRPTIHPPARSFSQSHTHCYGGEWRGAETWIGGTWHIDKKGGKETWEWKHGRYFRPTGSLEDDNSWAIIPPGEGSRRRGKRPPPNHALAPFLRLPGPYPSVRGSVSFLSPPWDGLLPPSPHGMVCGTD